MGSPTTQAAVKARACSNCARLKTKCQWAASGSRAANGSSCTRCSRMALDCRVPETQSQRKRGKSVRVAQLESKIDSLVALFAAGQNSQAREANHPPLTPESQDITCNNQPTRSRLPTGVADASSDRERLVGATRPPPASDAGHDVAYELLPGFGLSHTEAVEYLDMFRTRYAPQCSSVVVSPDKTHSELFDEEPALFWAIMITPLPLPLDMQPAIKAKVRQLIVDQVVVRQEKRLQLLQATIVYLQWSEYHYMHESHANPMIHIATSLIIDLMLDKPVKAVAPPPSKTLLRDALESVCRPPSKPRAELSADEIRALLGHYHLASIASLFFGRGTTPAWTSHHSHSCEALIQASHSLPDRILVAMVTLQRISEQAASHLSTFGVSDSTFTPPLDMALASVRREMDDLMDCQEEDVKNDLCLRAVYCSLMLRLYEPIVSMKPGLLARPDGHAGGCYKRTGYLWQCIQLSSDLFNTVTSIPPEKFSSLPCSVWALCSFDIVVVSRVLIVDSTPDWDPEVARRAFDFPEMLRRISDKFSSADTVCIKHGWKRPAKDSGIIIFPKFAMRTQWIASWYISAISASSAPKHTDEIPTAGPAPTLAGAEARGLPMAVGWGREDAAFEDSWQNLMSFQDSALLGNFSFDSI